MIPGAIQEFYRDVDKMKGISQPCGYLDHGKVLWTRRDCCRRYLPAGKPCKCTWAQSVGPLEQSGGTGEGAF